MPCLIALVLAFSAAACLNNQTGPDASAGTPFELKSGVTASLPNGTRLTFDKVKEDSRCPADAQCIWAGDAVVAVTLQAPRGPAESRELHTQATGSQISYSDYTIKLTALAPYPRSSQQIQPGDYIASFVVDVR